VPVGAEAVVDVLQLLEPLAVVGTVNGLKHFGGIAVESLTRRAGAGGLARDGAVHTLEDSGSVGDAKGWRDGGPGTRGREGRGVGLPSLQLRIPQLSTPISRKLIARESPSL